MNVLHRLSSALGLLALAIVLGAWVWSTQQPTAWSVQAEATLRATAAEVEAQVAAPARWPAWIHGEDGAGAEWTPFGPATGVGAGQAWRSPRSEGRLTLVAAEAGAVRYTMALPAGDVAATGTIRWSEGADGTRVTWTDEGDYSGKLFAGLWVGPMSRRAELQMKQALRRLGEVIEAGRATP